MTFKWVAKAIVQKTISLLPYSYNLNFLFQKYVTRGVKLTDDFFTDRLEHAKNHCKYYGTTTGNVVPSNTLELGTGWYPVVPIYLYLKGCENIWTIDIAEHFSNASTLQTANKFLAYMETGRIVAANEGFAPERVATLNHFCSTYKPKSAGRALEKLGINYKCIDARQTTFGNNYFDLIHSNNTLEHIYPSILKGIVCECARILKVEGIMSHFIDMSDHFARFDQSITIYNYLRFSNTAWKIIDNRIQPQSRLRMSDYLALFGAANLKSTLAQARPGSPSDLKRIKINRAFAQYSLSDLATSHCHIILQK